MRIGSLMGLCLGLFCGLLASGCGGRALPTDARSPEDDSAKGREGGARIDLGGPGCSASAACDPGSYCHFDQGCGKASAGVCREKPQSCNMLYAPVCGCDGKDYGNACGAYGAGVSVASQGKCGSKGCKTDADCTKGSEWCTEGICQPCDNSGTACYLACPMNWKLYTRNGCTPCECAPPNPCASDGECGSGRKCYAGSFCWDWCPPGDPSCCFGNICSQTGCKDPPPIGCRIRGCPAGQQCHSSGCASSGCDCAGGAIWGCVPDCNGGVCAP